jgi:hypothetical protein
MKTTSNQFGDIYEKIFNLIFDTGIIPESWLLGTMKPFYKNKGNKNDPKNYIVGSKFNVFSGSLVSFKVFKSLKKLKSSLNSISGCLVDFPVFKIFQYSFGSFFRNVFIRLDISFRPITILSCLGKLFTAILNNRLNTYSESFLLLNENQCGFRKGYSTLDCIYSIHAFFKLKSFS